MYCFLTNYLKFYFKYASKRLIYHLIVTIMKQHVIKDLQLYCHAFSIYKM